MAAETSFASTTKVSDVALNGLGSKNQAFESDELPTYDKVDEVGEVNHVKQGQNGLGGTGMGHAQYNTYEDATQPDEGVAVSNENNNILIRIMIWPIAMIKKFYEKHTELVIRILKLLLVLGYVVYMIFALVRNFNDALPLFIIFCAVLFFSTYGFIRDKFGDEIWVSFKPFYHKVVDNLFWLKWVFIGIFVALLITWIALDTSKRPNQLISLAGYIVLIFCLFLGSKHPYQVWWRPVFWGFGVQMVFALFCLRTSVGYSMFSWLGFFVQTFLNFTDYGAKFVFGDVFYEHYFAFKVLPIILYFSSFISVVYYLGGMQWLIFKLAWLMQFSLGTSATESMVAAGNIFVGQTESPLLIRPYIKDLTSSELHAIMVCGFGTIAGSVLGAYLGFGIDAVYLMTACFMAAPACLAVSKLIYPETEKSKFKEISNLAVEKTGQQNVVEAAAVGAISAIPLVLNIAANLIAFISLLAAINALLGWYGGLMGFPQLSFELICSYLFVPISFLMGIEWRDCFECAELIGIKIFLNEFVAYGQMSELINNRTSGDIPRDDEFGTYWISLRSEAIITYALCGFANVSSIGIMLGGLSALCPERRGEMSQIVIRALIGGIMVSILNGAMAGFLYVPPTANCKRFFNYTIWDGREYEVGYCCSDILKNTTLSVTDLNDACNCCAYSNASSVDFDSSQCQSLSC